MHVIFSFLFLIIGSLASGQTFSVADREVHFYKEGGPQSVTLEQATGVAMGTTVFYSAARADDTDTDEDESHASPEAGVEVRVPLMASVTKTGDAPATREDRTTEDPYTHPTLVTGTWSGADTVTGVAAVMPKGGSALTKQTTLANLASGQFHVTADFTVSVFNEDIGTDTGDILTYTVTYTVDADVVETGTTTPHSTGTAGTAIKRDDGGFDYPLGGGLFLKYEGRITDASDETNADGDASMRDADTDCADANTRPSYCVGSNDPGDDYYTVDASRPPTLWGNMGLTATGKHTFTYQLGANDTSRTDYDELNYSVLILDPNVWGTTSATLSIAENSEDLSALNSAIASDRNSDGTAAADRKISFSLAKGSNVFRVTNGADDKAATNTGIPVLALHTNARGETTSKIDYENSDDGMIEVQICASGDHVPMGSGPDGAQCYTLNVVVTQVNEGPTMVRGKSFKPVYLVQEDPLPTTILLTDYFEDPEDDNLTMTLTPATGTGATGLTTQTVSVAGGYDVTATIVGGTVLSFSKKLPEGEVLTQGVKTYTFMIYANDGEFDSPGATYTINIKIGTNTAPVWIGGVQSATWTITENATGAFSDSVSATDVDGDPLTFELPGQRTLHARFANYPVLRLAGTCLRVVNTDGRAVVSVVNAALLGCKGFNYEAGSTQTFQISVKDNYGGVAPPVTVTVMVTDVNEPPFHLGTLTNINMYTGTKEVRVLSDHFRDPEGTAMTFDAVSRSSAMARASLSGDVLTLTAVGEGTTNILIIAADATGLSVTHEFPIKIKRAGSNNSPFFNNNLDAVTFTVVENSPSGTSIGSPLTATDPDEDPITYELLSHKDRFNISQANGQLSAKASAALNHEVEEVIHFIVRVTDGDFGGFDYVEVTLIVEDVNEAPTSTGDIPDQMVIIGDTTDVQIDMYFDDEDEIDKGNLFFSPFVVNPLLAEASSTRGVITVSGLEIGETSVVVTAIDSGQEEAIAEFGVTIVENLPPRLVNPVAMQVVMPNIPAIVDISNVFEDEQTLTFAEPVSGNPDVLLVTLVGTDDDHLALVGRTAGLTTVTITAMDPSGGSASHTFDVRVNSNPVLTSEIADQLVNHGSSVLIDLSGHFSDPDAGDTLTFTAISDNEFAANPLVTGNILEIDGNSPGEATITVTAEDDWGATVMDSFMVEVNALPMVAMEIEDVNLVRTTDSVEIDLSMHFSDADDQDALTFEATSSMDGVVSVFVAESTLIIQGVAPGMTMISVTATDPHDASATDMFGVRVNAEPMVAMAIDDIILKDPMASVEIDLSTVFEDADEMDMLSFTAASADDNIATAGIHEHHLHVQGVAAGTTTITVVATDDLGAYTMDSFMVRVNAVPMVVTAIEDMNLVTPADSLMVDLSMHFSDADEEDMLTYMAESSNMDAATVSVDGAMLTVQGVAPGDTEITVTATDDNGAYAMDMFMVHVNAVPMVAMEIDDMILQSPDASADLDLNMYFSDADMETLTYSAESSDTMVVTALVDGTTLTVQGVTPGNAMVTVTATDMLGASAMDSFMVRVNAVPMVANPLADVTVTVGTPLMVDVSNTFTDADAGDTLSLSAMSSDTSLATVAISGTSLTITGVLPGTLDTTVTATDDHGASASDTFTVTVKTVPMVAASLPNVNLEVGGEPNVSDVAGGFSDADGDPLTYSVSLAASGIATSAISGSMLTLEAVQKGMTSATVTATDPDGNSASQTFSIDVNNDALVAQANKNLAVFGQAMLGSFSNAIGNRVTKVRNGTNVTSIKQVLSSLAETASTSSGMSFSSGIGGLGMSGGHHNIVQKDILDLSPSQSMNSSHSLGSLNFDRFSRFSAPRNFALNLGADGGGIGIWGSADTTNYEGTDYDGDASFIHLGADFETANCWLFGVAVTRGTGSNTFSYGTAERDMDITLTAFSPYLRYQPSDDASIWGAASFGSGEVDITGGADNATSDLESNLFLFGGRRTVNEMGNMTLALRGEVAVANLSTDSGDDIASGLDVSVNRVRGVLEATFGDAESGFQPFIDLGIRNDGGDGDTGTGFEVAGGVKIDSESLAIEARAHTLATHGADDYGESGVSLLARIQPRSASGEGLAFEFAPRYGANYSSSGLIWNLEQQQMRQSRSEGRDEQQGLALASRLSYSVAVSGDRFLISPFVDYDKQQADRTRILIGTEIGSILENAQRVSVEAAVGRIQTRNGQSDQLVGMNARFEFK